MNSINNINRESFYQTINELITFLRYQPEILGYEGFKILSLLNRMKSLKENSGLNHPSMPNLLNHIGNILDESNLLQFSLLFFLEQLRIERYYLGSYHPDLAITLCKIGEIHIKNGQFSEAKKSFIGALLIMKNNNIKGRLYALIIYNLGLVKYYQHSYDYAFELFNISVKELRATCGNFHRDVAEIHLKIADLQKEIGKLKDAMDNYLEALIILRMNCGNIHQEVFEVLCKIGFIHKAKDEYHASSNSFNQALDVLRELQGENTCMILILYEIGLIHQATGDITNTIKICKEVVELLKLQLGEKHICLVSVLALLCNLYSEHGMTENLKNTNNEIRDICNKASHIPNLLCNDEFENVVIQIFGYPIEYSPPVAGAA